MKRKKRNFVIGGCFSFKHLENRNRHRHTDTDINPDTDTDTDTDTHTDTDTQRTFLAAYENNIVARAVLHAAGDTRKYTPHKKLLGSWFSNPYTLFFFICTINFELNWFPNLYH